MAEMHRFNAGKPQLSFIPTSFHLAMLRELVDYDRPLVEEISKVLTFGAAKYARNNWRKSGSWCKVADSASRHILWHMEGQAIDMESGLPHLAHIGCNILFLIEFAEYNLGTDDRHTPDGTYLDHLISLDDGHWPSIVRCLLALSSWLDGNNRGLYEALKHLSAAFTEMQQEPKTWT